MKKSSIIIIVILGVFLVLTILSNFIGYKKYKDNLEFFNSQKDSLNLVIKGLNEDLEKHERIADSLTCRIDELNADLQKIEKKYDKKVNTIISYSNPELEQFFAERYER